MDVITLKPVSQTDTKIPEIDFIKPLCQNQRISMSTTPEEYYNIPPIFPLISYKPLNPYHHQRGLNIFQGGQILHIFNLLAHKNHVW